MASRASLNISCATRPDSNRDKLYFNKQILYTNERLAN